MYNGEKANQQESNSGIPDWQTIMQEYRDATSAKRDTDPGRNVSEAGIERRDALDRITKYDYSDESVTGEHAESETRTADEELARRAEVLSEEDTERLQTLVSEIEEIGRHKEIWGDECFVSEESIEELKAFLLPPEDVSLPAEKQAELIKNKLLRFEPDGPNADALRESRIKNALDYMQIRGRAEEFLSQYIAEHEDGLDEISASGLQEMARIVQPQPGDDFARLQYTTSMLADGNPVDAGNFLRDIHRKDIPKRRENGKTKFEARIRDLGNFHILKDKIAAATGRQDIDDAGAADILASEDNDAVTRFLRVCNPLRMDRDRTRESDWDYPQMDASKAPEADVSGVCEILSAYDNSQALSVEVFARQYGANEILSLSQEETSNIAGFINHVAESFDNTDGFSEGTIGRLSMIGNALIACKIRDGDKMKRGALVRENGGVEAAAYFDTALDIARDESLDAETRQKKLRLMLNMVLVGIAAPGRLDGIKNNLLPAFDRGDEDALSMIDDEYLPDGTPNPDTDKNWTRGFGLGVADYKAQCYILPATPQNIHELILQHDSLPSLNSEQFFQNREDSRVLATDDNNNGDGCIFYSRDFVHNQMPHAHEVLVYQWAYQKIGRGEEFSEEEMKMLRQIGKTPPSSEMSDEQRKEYLDALGEDYLGFLEQNKELINVVLGEPGLYIKREDLAEGEDPNNISDESVRLGHKRALEKYAFDLSRYDSEVELLDTASGVTKTEKVSDVLWRLCKNTDKLTIEAPDTGDAELNEMLSRLDLTVDEKGECPIELRDLTQVMPEINKRLIQMRGKCEMTPGFIAGLSYLSRAANHAVKDLPPKELREIFYDPTFKEIVRFHSLTWQKGGYSEADFDNMWRKFSNVRMEDDDQLRLEKYAVLNRTILNQSESLVQMYRSRAAYEDDRAEQLLLERDNDRYDGIGFGVADPYVRSKLMLERHAEEHERQANMHRNFANSVWSLNLSSTLAKIGLGLAQ